MSQPRSKIHFVPHGGGPLPILGEPGHKALVDCLKSLEAELHDASALIVVTAHWETEEIKVSGAAEPGMIFDYYGFPPETYTYSYPAPGAPDLAAEAIRHLAKAGLPGHLDAERGYDHGTFVPLMLMRPKADIPVIQVSILSSMDPAAHIATGRALAPLLETGAVLIGSGLSFHNLKAMLRNAPMENAEDKQFDDWLNGAILGDDPERHLLAWKDAPAARFCHPREDHLLPLHVCLGAGLEAGLTPKPLFCDKVMGFQASGFSWS
ncbi:MAG: DODA-type extradiol aromatic ring-opening family dioxygenase [Magnetovibrionaceae bacterium]